MGKWAECMSEAMLRRPPPECFHTPEYLSLIKFVYTYPGHPDIRLRIGLSFTRTRVKCTLSGALRYANRSDSKTISKVDNPDVSIRLLQV